MILAYWSSYYLNYSVAGYSYACFASHSNSVMASSPAANVSLASLR